MQRGLDSLFAFIKTETQVLWFGLVIHHHSPSRSLRFPQRYTIPEWYVLSLFYSNKNSAELLLIQVTWLKFLDGNLQVILKEFLKTSESFTYMPLRKLPVTHMPWKCFQILVCHALKIR
jgi:hypothetical protein